MTPSTLRFGDFDGEGGSLQSLLMASDRPSIIGDLCDPLEEWPLSETAGCKALPGDILEHAAFLHAGLLDRTGNTTLGVRQMS